jgi:hypothetical protein
MKQQQRQIDRHNRVRAKKFPGKARRIIIKKIIKLLLDPNREAELDVVASVSYIKTKSNTLNG